MPMLIVYSMKLTIINLLLLKLIEMVLLKPTVSFIAVVNHSQHLKSTIQQ